VANPVLDSVPVQISVQELVRSSFCWIHFAASVPALHRMRRLSRSTVRSPSLELSVFCCWLSSVGSSLTSPACVLASRVSVATQFSWPLEFPRARSAATGEDFDPCFSAQIFGNDFASAQAHGSFRPQFWCPRRSPFSAACGLCSCSVMLYLVRSILVFNVDCCRNMFRYGSSRRSKRLEIF
jgi:hypothetical protein